MNNTLVKAVTILSIIFVSFTACKPEDNPTPGSNNGNKNNNITANFYAKVDNQEFDNGNTLKTQVNFIQATKMLQIIGQFDDSKETIILTLMPMSPNVQSLQDWKPGTYNFDATEMDNIKYVSLGEYNKWNGSNYEQWFSDGADDKGKIVITTNDGTTIVGNFEFEAAYKNTDGSFNTNNKKIITEGKFDLQLN